MGKIGKRTGYHMVYILARTKNMIKVGKVSEKYDILIVEGKLIALIGKETKIILEMTPGQRELETRLLKASKRRIKKRIE